MKKSASVLLLSTLSGGLTACGGGDSGSGGSNVSLFTPSDTVPKVAEIVITDENALAVAKSAAKMLNDSLTTASLNEFMDAFAAASNPVAGSEQSFLKRIADLNRERFSGLNENSATYPVGVEVNKQQNCPISGSVQVYFVGEDSQDPFHYIGDYGKLIYDHCVESRDGTLYEQDGTTEFKVNDGSESYSNTEMAFDNYRMTYEEVSLYSDASRINIQEWGETSAFDYKYVLVTNGDLNFSFQGQESNLKYNQFTDQVVEGEEGAGAMSYRYDGLYDYGINGDFQGALEIRTGEPFIVYYGEDFPRSGQAVWQGVSGSIRMTIFSQEEVQIELDGDDDGDYESSEVFTWAELIA
ncbi:hypothetical protein [Thiomicrorhabdus sp.]|uniref:hypothetical protein n=1 Tax=Thiomicrorhabdus sp. TaxID=2039724 RepID=UPI0029C71C98|nr:hypothetical protein [Thiomicrorhabdus sp.]